MTIKQQGGVFGRNPTFNDVTIEGQLTFDGDIDINSDLKVSGDIETTGNVIIGTSGKGIDFSATAGPNPPASGTSELLDDYEEGTWTPSLGGTATYSALEANYVKVGSLVQVKATILVNAIGTGSATTISGLPYPNGDGIAALSVALMLNSGTSVVYVVSSIAANSSTITMRGLTAAGTTMTIPNIFGNGTYVEMSGSYSTVT